MQTLPLLPVLKERFPHAEISWVINSELADLLKGHPHLDHLIRYERRGGIAGWRSLLHELKRKRFDLVFDLQGLLRTGVMNWATRAPLRVGLETAREGSHLVCNQIIPDSGKHVPAHLRYWRVAEALGLGNAPRETYVPIRNEDHQWVRDQLAQLQGPILAIHPGARWRTKRWPVEKYAAVAAKAVRNYGFSIVLLGSPQEFPYAAQLEQVLYRLLPGAPVLNMAGSTTLKQLAAVLSTTDVLLSNDSGPMHLAAGLGVPVVGIFTCTSPIRSGAPGEQHEWVTTNLSCAAKYKKKCPYRGKKHMACFEEISTERVWQSFLRLMEKNAPLKRAA